MYELIEKHPMVIFISVLMIIAILYFLIKPFNSDNQNDFVKESFIQTFSNPYDSLEIKTINEKDKYIIENFPSAEMNVMYSDANGNLATTQDLGLKNLTVSGDSKFVSNINVNGNMNIKSDVNVTGKVTGNKVISDMSQSQGGWGMLWGDNCALIGKSGSDIRFGHANDTNASSWSEKMNIKPDGTVNVPGSMNIGGDLTLKGDNAWILHTPDDGRKTMYFAPIKNDNSGWNWDKQVNFSNKGEIYASGNISTSGQVNTNGKSNYPAGWGGGVRTWDLYGSGTLGWGDDNANLKTTISGGNINTNGNINAGSDINTNGKIKEGNKELMPRGTIVMWNGSTAPAGWSLCDGTNGTPDLRGRFIRMYSENNNATGWGAYYKNITNNSKQIPNNIIGISRSDPRSFIFSNMQVGDMGGTDHHVLGLDEIPGHTHTGSVSVSGNTSSNGSHNHTFTMMGNAALHDNWIPSRGSHYPIEKGQTDSSGDHTHTVTASGSFTTASSGAGWSHNSAPPYYVLAFIMKL